MARVGREVAALNRNDFEVSARGESSFTGGGRDLNTQPGVQPVRVLEHPGPGSGRLRAVEGGGEVPAKVLEHSTCHTVTREGQANEREAGRDWTEAALAEALANWTGTHDEDALRRRLVDLLRRLGG
jgi:hypothetical protein